MNWSLMVINFVYQACLLVWYKTKMVFPTSLTEAGIQPHATLHHFDLPQVLEDEYGGWLSRHIVYAFFLLFSFFHLIFCWFYINLLCNECRRDFTAYADTCFKEFGDRVLHWTTINELNVFALGGYDRGLTPPGRCSPSFGLNCSQGNSSTEPYIAAHNMLLAHASATNLYKKQYQVPLPLLSSICTYRI